MSGSPEVAAKLAEVLAEELAALFAYHQLSCLHPEQPAAAPARLQRRSEPIPFRRYLECPRQLLPLPEDVPAAGPASAGGLSWGFATLGRLFGESLAITGWRRAGDAAFGLRRVPSAGNLHPTEAYLITSGDGEDSCPPGLYHYSPFDHSLECRRRFPPELGHQLAALHEAPTSYVGLSTVFWRTAWKYGERAFRLGHLDAGHAVAALAAAAELMGAHLRRVELADEELEAALGLSGEGPEAERGLLLLEIRLPGPDGRVAPAPAAATPLFREQIAAMASLPLAGQPSQVSQEHRLWPGIDSAVFATRSTPLLPAADGPAESPAESPPQKTAAPPFTAAHLRRRRSCKHFDPAAWLATETCFTTLELGLHLWPTLLPCRPDIATLVAIHRVHGIDRGLYLLLSPGAADVGEELLRHLSPAFNRRKTATLAGGDELVLLAAGDARAAFTRLAGDQPAAGDAAFTLVLLGRGEPLLAARGPAAYKALHWQAGLLGHGLYLAATRAGLGVTGLSGFYDELLLDLLGLPSSPSPAFLPLYLIAIGVAADPEEQLEPPYTPRSPDLEPRPPSRGGRGSAGAP